MTIDRSASRARARTCSWGCFSCRLPNDGALAVLCDACLERWKDDESILKTACRGYPATDGRIAIAELPPGDFRHNDAAHAADRSEGAPVSDAPVIWLPDANRSADAASCEKLTRSLVLAAR
jgi:hypothetical protein